MPVPAESRSHWLAEALAAEAPASAPLEGEARADMCIVGGGFTGLWAALRLKELEPSLDVVLIEKDLCGAGSSGRNGGFAMTWSSKISTLLKIAGAQEALRMFRASEEAVRAIGAFCAAEGIAADFRPDGWLWTASSEAQMNSWRQAVDDLDRLGAHPFEELGRAEAQARAGSELHIGGVFEAGVATVQPAKLARGLARVARARGVRIHEGTPMTGLVRGRPAVVRTPHGRVRAGTVVLALNAWAAGLRAFRPHMLALASDIIATAPIPDRLAEVGLTDGRAISDSRLLVNYYRTTVDGRLVWGVGGGAFPFGSGPGTMLDGETPRRAELMRIPPRHYPSLAGIGWGTSWRGPTTRTATGLPFFGRLAGAPNVVYGHGYTGNGVAPSWMGGRILASLALGLDDEWSGMPIAKGPPGPRFPPEPFRWLGSYLVRDAIARKERADDAGRPPARLDLALARLAPAGLVPVARKEG